MQKLSQVIMLPTNKGQDSNLFFHCPLGSKIKTLSFMTQGKAHREEMLVCGVNKPQHLYICSNDEIKEGDWVINGNITAHNHAMTQIKAEDVENVNKLRLLMLSDKFPYACKGKVITLKIIASTDSSLSFTAGQKHIGQVPPHERFPSIPQWFIEYYISEYNKGNIIKEVEVEYTEHFTFREGDVMEVKNEVYGFNKGDKITVESLFYRGDKNMITFKEDTPEGQGFHISHLVNPIITKPKLNGNEIIISKCEEKLYTKEELITVIGNFAGSRRVAEEWVEKHL